LVKCDPKRRTGFTLVELLVVLAVLALVMALVPPYLVGAAARAQLTSAAHEIALALRETRSLAVRQGRPERFVVDGEAGTFRAAGGALRRLPAGMILSLAALADNRAAAARGAILFFPDGGSTGGRLRLKQGERQADVAVDWLTGGVSLAAAR
jgi:general secretion pathway protein H